MAIETLSSFYYGHDVSDENNKIGFDEGSGELTATIAVGEYTLEEYADQVAVAMNDAGTQTYSVSVDRTNRKLTISASSNFSLLVNSSATDSTTAYTLMGFTGADLTGSNSYTGDTGSGKEYRPQFWLNNYVPKENKLKRVSSARSQSASGNVQVFSFGEIKFVVFEIMFATDIDQGTRGAIETNLSGVADLNDFMSYATGIRPVEFMPDRDTPNTFDKLLLENTPQSGDGTDYELQEMLGRGLAGYYMSGRLEWRVL